MNYNTVKATTAKNEATFENCPFCGSVMRRTRIGGGSRSQRAWICRVSEDEVSRDERGHLIRRDGAVHPSTRVWTESELAIAQNALAAKENENG